MTRRLLPLVPLLALAAPAPLRAGPADPIRLAVRPAAPPARLLQYPLLPEVSDQTPGNAATHYNEAGTKLKALLDKEFVGANWQGMVSTWLDVPLDEFPADEVREFLKAHEPVLRELEAGARCDHCDWGHVERLRKYGFNALIPEIQQARDLSNLLCLRVRLEAAQGDLPRAVRDLQTGFAQARHVNASPLLISGLVSVALTTRVCGRVDDLVQQPGTPNLYWALADLPSRFVDMGIGFGGERLAVRGSFPGLAEMMADRNAGPMSPEQLEKVAKMVEFLEISPQDRELYAFLGLDLAKSRQLRRSLSPWLIGSAVLANHQAAKAALVAAGRPREKVEAMPHLQVALLHGMLEYDRGLDQILAWHRLPYPEGLPRLRAAFGPGRGRMQDASGLALAQNLLPASFKVVLAEARVERRLAALRVVEALRLYAANHDGELPAALADIKEVPVPDDPVTGRPFDYKREGARATLSAPAPAGDPPNPGNTLTYEITLTP
jgi:hypothetical protein